MASEFGFRPCKIEDLKGQPKVQKMLQIYIFATIIPWIISPYGAFINLLMPH